MKEKNADQIVERIFSVAHANYKGYLNYSGNLYYNNSNHKKYK